MMKAVPTSRLICTEGAVKSFDYWDCRWRGWFWEQQCILPVPSIWTLLATLAPTFSELSPFHLITNLWLALFISVIQLGVTSALSPSLNIFTPSVSWSQPVKQLHRRLRTINSQLFWTAWDVSHLTQWLVEETDKWFFIGGWSVSDSLYWHFRCQEVQILAWYLCTFSPYGFGSSCKEMCFSPYGSYLEFSVSSLIRNWKSVGVIYISICHCCYCLSDNHIQMLMSN